MLLVYLYYSFFLPLSLKMKHIITILSLLAVAAYSQDYTLTTNYASAYLGANIADHSPKAVGARNILNDGKEKYMIIPCNIARKQFTVQLSREIHVNLVTLSNLEYFSSPVKNFTLLGSVGYPCQSPGCQWRVLGNYQANFTRRVQHFRVDKLPPVRYIRFLWVSRHGRERSCTMTSFQVFGTDALENLAAELAAGESASKADVAQHSAPQPKIGEGRQTLESFLAGEQDEEITEYVAHPIPIPTLRFDYSQFARLVVNSTPSSRKDTSQYFTEGDGARCFIKWVPKARRGPKPSHSMGSGLSPVYTLLSQVRSWQSTVGTLTSHVSAAHARVIDLEKELVRVQSTCHNNSVKNSALVEARFANISALAEELQARLDRHMEESSQSISLQAVMTAASLFVGVASLMCGLTCPHKPKPSNPYTPPSSSLQDVEASAHAPAEVVGYVISVVLSISYSNPAGDTRL